MNEKRGLSAIDLLLVIVPGLHLAVEQSGTLAHDRQLIARLDGGAALDRSINRLSRGLRY